MKCIKNLSIIYPLHHNFIKLIKDVNKINILIRSMCGFLFEYSKLSLSDKQKFQNGLNSISHRGPDSINIWENENIRMGHARLSIIDLSKKSNQPFKYGNLNLIYNGEIFNYKEIRSELKLLGYKFETNSDTEVVLMAYHKWGEKCVLKFNGMWAFVIYDEIKKRNIWIER